MSNLLPPAEKRSLLGLYRKRFLSVVFLFVIILAAVSTALLLPSLFVLKTDEAMLTQRRDDLAGHETSQVESSLAATISDINARLAVFPDKTVSSPVIAGLINPVLKLKTSAVHITAFSFKDGGSPSVPSAIEISGTTDTRADLLDFADQLKGIGNFTNVDVPIQSYVKNSNVTFTITAEVVPQK